MKETNIPDSILTRIQKLYNKSISSKSIGSLAEAESFMLKVQQLLSEYNLEMSLLNDNKGEKSEIIENVIDYKGLVSYGTWEVSLMTAICRYNWCRCFYQPGSKKITIIGRGDNIGVCKYLFNFITINLVTLSKSSYYSELDRLNTLLGINGDYCADNNITSIPEFEEHMHKGKYIPYRRYYIRDYLAGAVIGIDTKFARQQAEQSKAANVNGLILFNKEKINDYIKQFHPNLETEKSREKKRGKGFYEGYLGGLNLHIGEGLDGVKSKAELK